MSAHLTEEEQIEAFKRWWKENGTSTLLAIVVAVAGYFGWQGWQSNQQAQREGSSALFQQMAEVAVLEPGQVLSEDQLLQVASLGEQMKEQYPGTFYATSAALLLAKHAVDQSNLDEAKSQLLWAQGNNDDATLKPVIDQRLARVLLAQGQAEEALALVKIAPSEEFTSNYAEVRGDALAALGDTSGAREAYTEALDTLPAEQNPRQRFLEMKRDQYPVSQVVEAN